MDSNYLDNFYGSSSANVVTGIIFFTLIIVKRKCSQSTCSSHTRCCKCKIKDEGEESITEGRNEGEELV